MARCHAGWLLLCLALASCATTSPARTRTPPITLEDELRAEMASQDAMAWSASRPLVWSDFKAAAPTGGAEGAHTAYLIVYGSRCRGTTFQFLANAAFLPDRSWVKRVVLNSPAESRRTLTHEQTHFNLTEVHARRMRKYFAEEYNPCGQTADRLRAMAERFVSDESNAQERYDRETEHGLVAARQRTWDKDVSDMLKELDKYGTGL